MQMSQEEHLVPTRSCDQCTACCVTLRIEQDCLKKHADDPCPHLSAHDGCGIYSIRPSVCRSWYCGWRYMQQLGEEWRPDRSKVLIRLRGGSRGGLILQPLESPLRILTTQPVLELVGGCVEQSIPVLISVPGKAGHCYALVELNKMLAPAVRSLSLERARAAMVEAVNYAYHIPTDPIKPLGSCS